MQQPQQQTQPVLLPLQQDVMISSPFRAKKRPSKHMTLPPLTYDGNVPKPIGLLYSNEEDLFIQGLPSFQFRMHYNSRSHMMKQQSLWVTDNATFGFSDQKRRNNLMPSGEENGQLFMKVLCIRLMQLLGPQQAQVDTVETCLYALLKLLKLQTVRALSIEDFLDFLLMDVEHVPTSYGKHRTSPPIAQQRMHHKFAVQPEENENRSQTGQQQKCNHCLKEEETKTALTKESPFQSQTLLRNPSLQQVSKESIHQQQEDRRSNEHQSALIFHLESRIVISNSQSLAFDHQIGNQNREIVSNENMSRNKPNDVRGGTAQFGNKSTILPEGSDKKERNNNNAYSQDHLNQRVVDIAASMDQIGGIPSQTGAEEDQDDLEAAALSKNIESQHQAEDVIDEVESQRQIISQYMENLLSQQRHEVNKDIQRTLQTLNQEDESMRPIEFGSQRSLVSKGPVLPRHRSFMAASPGIPGYTQQQQQRLDDSNPPQYKMSGTITNQLNAPASGFGMQKQTRNVAIKTVNSNQYKGIKMDQTLNSHQEPRNQNIVGSSQYIDNSNLEIAYPLETSNRQNEYFSRRKFSDHQIPLQSLFQTHSLQASRRGDQSHHNRQNSSSKQNFKMMFQNPGLRNNLRKQYQASEIGTVQLRQLHDDQPLNGNIQLQEESQRRIIGNNEDEMSMSQSIMNLNKVVGGDENRSEFGDMGLRGRGDHHSRADIQHHQTPEMLIERKAAFGSHKKSLPINTLKSAIKDKSLALSQLRLGSKKQRSILDQDNQSNSIIGQNLFDPSANNSIRGEDHHLMYQTSQDIFNNSRSRVAQANAGQTTSQKDQGYFTKPLTKRQYTNKLSNLENYLTENQSEIQLGQQGVLVGQGVTRIVRQSINDKLNGNVVNRQIVMASQNNLVLKSDQQSVIPQSIDRLDEDGSFVIDDLVQNGPLCFICGLELEDHALDYNVDLHFYQDLLQDCFVGDKNMNAANNIVDKNFESSLNGQKIHHEHNFSASRLVNQKPRTIQPRSNFSSSQVSHRDLNQFTQLKLNIENKKKKDRHQNQSSKQQILRQFTDSQLANNSQTQSPRFNPDMHQQSKQKSEKSKPITNEIAHKKQQVPQQRQSMLFKIEPDINLNKPMNYSDYDIPKTGAKKNDKVDSGEFTRDKTHPVFTSFGVMPEKVMLKVNHNTAVEQQQMQQNSNRSRSVQQAHKVTLKYKSGKSGKSELSDNNLVLTDSDAEVQIPKFNQTKDSTTIPKKPNESLADKLISLNGARAVAVGVLTQLQQDQIDIVNQILTIDQIKAFEEENICQICCSNQTVQVSDEITHPCGNLVCADCMAKCDNVCPYCQLPENAEIHQHKDEVESLSRCLNCGSLPYTINNELKERVCLQCDYAQCTQCTLAAHIGMNCEQAVEKSYTDLKKVFSSVTLDPTIQYQMCTKCDTILEKALHCNHYHCERCNVTFCMYCRLPYSESHMNPFTEDACCLFKIGASKKSRSGQASSVKQNDKQSSKIRWLAFALLVLWLLFGLLVSFIFIPIVSYYKLVRNPTYLNQSSSYLIAKTSAKKNLNLTSYALWISLVALTPICMPFVYIAGITYFVHMMLFPVVQERRDQDSQLLTKTIGHSKGKVAQAATTSTTRKNEKVHTEISLLNDKNK